MERRGAGAVLAIRKPHTIERPALQEMLARVEGALSEALELLDERNIDPLWTAAAEQVRAFALRTGKRTRPVLALIGYGLATGGSELNAEMVRAAAALELLHTFLLIHDDVADAATLRRGKPCLHRVLGPGKRGEDLAVVMGDHLFARALELLLEGRSPRSMEAALYLLQCCRFTAAGQLLDIQLSQTPLAEVTLFQTMKVANLKTARYGFVAPLACGAILGGAGPELREALERAGRCVGIAFQLRDDLIGLYGSAALSGKSSASDYLEGKRTFPVMAAYARAGEAGRRRIEALWAKPDKDEASLAAARVEIERHGGRRATERVIERMTRVARRALSAVPHRGESLALLDGLFAELASRAN